MTILPKKDKSENSDSDGSNSSTNSTNTTPRDAYQHTGSCHNEDYDSASQSKPGSVSRSKRRLRAAVSTRPLQTARPTPLSLTVPLLPTSSASCSTSSSLPQSSTCVTKPRKIPALVAAGYSSDECNSAEEYDASTRSKTDSEREQRFEEYLWKEWGFIIKQTARNNRGSSSYSPYTCSGPWTASPRLHKSGLLYSETDNYRLASFV